MGHAFVLWSPVTPFRDVARTALSPAPELESSFHPTYNLAVNLVRRWSREEAHALVASSYGQWQAPAGSVSLAAQLDRRLAVLEGRGFVDGWRLTDEGAVLAGIYHESDLLVAEAVRQGVLDDLAPPALAGVISALTFEPRRANEGVGVVPPFVDERVDVAPGGVSRDPDRRAPSRTASNPTSRARTGYGGGGVGIGSQPRRRCCSVPRWPRATSSATSASSSISSSRWPTVTPGGGDRGCRHLGRSAPPPWRRPG